MATHLKTKEQEEADVKDRLLNAEVEEALRQILTSQPFRTSKQCKDLLQYVVEHSLRGDDGALRERVIGTEVFGRKPAYDTNEDPVVRTRAADVRKRLAQFYQSVEPGTRVLHIELQPGSYRVHFRSDPQFSVSPTSSKKDLLLSSSVDEASQPASALPRTESEAKRISRRRWIPIFLVVTVLLMIAGAMRVSQQSATRPQERFWAPFTTAKQPVLLYLGTNAAYIFSSDFLTRYRTAHGMSNTGPEFFVDLPAGSSVKADELIPVKDTFVSTADTAAVVQLATQLRDWKTAFVLRTGRDLSFGDLRNRPTILIGAFNNPWTLELNNDLPFRFREGVRIDERDRPNRSWSVPANARSSTTEDYALITRLIVSKTGGPSMTVAGIGEYGTQAAAEFLTSPEKMRDLLKSAPPGWENKNMQAVLHVKVLSYQPVAVDVVSTSYW